ncbi:hypothetical protein HWB51_gp101 [Mycobacterium phage Cuke]|uniref:Uncharacterized protein n=1 Tax=Mycobacterium phage Cuke TaxID=2079417 RepID=A0A2L1IWZ6_9CAUD|nr:hypothetical protein HWB51_gp101 [Mycobacterium phage Cuke]AVD99711.1 hypothetical protein SEA_CUKE_95 [Mycobacterium phage Cuke]
MSYPINQGPKDEAIRVGCEKGFKDFIEDYKNQMGLTSMSSALRRLALIGAYCEATHGTATMPASYDGLTIPGGRKTKGDTGNPNEFNWGEDSNVD